MIQTSLKKKQGLSFFLSSLLLTFITLNSAYSQSPSSIKSRAKILFSKSQLTSSESEKTQIALEEIIKNLPPKMIDSIRVPLKVKIIDASKDKTSYGSKKEDLTLIEVLETNAKNLTKGDKQAEADEKQSLKNSVLRQFALIYFNKNLRNLTERKMFKQMGLFFKEGLIHKTRKNINIKDSRSLNEQERVSPAYFWAENFVEFMQNPEFQCRRPAIYMFYKKHFETNPFPKPPCKVNLKVDILSIEDLINFKSSTVQLDPKRIYQVHYLFASESPNPMSVVGHAMYRFVMCPEGKPLDDNCLLDANNDIVVSYRAHIEDLTINPIKGVTGEYPSKQFIMKFKDVLDEYTQLEDRKLLSLPLKLTKAEKEQFVYKVLEQNEEFEGSYKFFSENCSTLAWGLLQCAKYSKKLQKANILTPIGMFHELAKLKITNKDLLKDEDASISNGHYWPGVSTQIKATLKDVHSIFPKFPINDTKKFLNLSVKRREALFNRYYAKIKGNDEESIRKKELILLSFISVESHLAKRLFYAKLMRIQNVLVDGLENKSADKDAKEFAKVFSLLKNYIKNKAPTDKQKGHGLIVEGDNPTVEFVCNAETVVGDKTLQKHAEHFLSFFPKFTKDINEELEEINVFKEKLKVMAISLRNEN